MSLFLGTFNSEALFERASNKVSGSELVKTCIFMKYKYKIRQFSSIEQKKAPNYGGYSVIQEVLNA